MSTTMLLAEPITRTSTAEGVQFWVLGTFAVLGALGVVFATKAVYSALFLATTMIVIAVFYVAQGALFLGVAQVVVYTGAVMMLFLFVLMLIGVDSSDSLTETLRGQRIGAGVFGIGFGALLIGAVGNASVTAFAGFDTTPAVAGSTPNGNVEGLAALIFVRYLWAFELTGALLITATIGAMLLAHRETIGRRFDQRELSIRRFRALGVGSNASGPNVSGAGSDASGPNVPGGRVTPMPSPGVYARHNAVDIPALLPDGSYSDLSVSDVLTARDPRVPTPPPRATDAHPLDSLPIAAHTGEQK